MSRLATIALLGALTLSARGMLAAPGDEGVAQAPPVQGELTQKQMWGGKISDDEAEAHYDAKRSERPSRTEPLPRQLEGVGVEELLGAKVPTNLEFITSDGEATTLGRVLDGERPVILTLNYSSCPMLCSLQLNGFVEGLRQMKWTVDEEFDIVTVSLDPSESADTAAATKAKYLKDYGRGGKSAAAGWTFLHGDEAAIRTLANAVGFGYRYSETRDEYLHAAVLMVLTPSAEVSRYLYGIQFSPKTMRLSLAEASDGKYASTLDKLILYCFHYDETEGRYAPVARRIMSLGGLLTIGVLGVFVGGFWLRESRRGRNEKA